MVGALPLRALDEDRISDFRAALHGRLAASTANVVLSEMGKMLRFARKLPTIDVAPNIARLPVTRATKKYADRRGGLGAYLRTIRAAHARLAAGRGSEGGGANAQSWIWNAVDDMGPDRRGLRRWQ